MDIPSKLLMLYNKDTSLAFENLKELEALSDLANELYPFTDEFISMLLDEKYVIRVRGFRLLCKQAKWDTEKKIDANITLLLNALDDEKPTATRQKLKALEDVARYKPNLNDKIRDAALSIDLLKLKDTMQPLIIKDINHLLAIMDSI